MGKMPMTKPWWMMTEKEQAAITEKMQRRVNFGQKRLEAQHRQIAQIMNPTTTTTLTPEEFEENDND